MQPIVNIKFLADLKEFSTQMQNANRSLEKTSKKLQNVGTALTVGLTAPLLAFGAKSLSLFNEQAKAIAQVDAGLKSTGNTAGFTSQELQKMASSLQNNSLFGDEQILKDVTAQLLSFTNISGAAFERTQQAALDLATRLDGDVKSSTIQLGKALNDPVAGLSALSESGIQFSKDQKELINSLVETGNAAEAQSIILDELEKQYGGSAEAAAKAGTGPLKQLSNTLGDITEEFGAIIAEGIMPFVENLKEIAAGFSELSPATKKFIVIVGGVAAAIGPLLALAGTILPAIGTGLALLTGPIGLLVAGLTAVGVIIYKNWEPIKKTLVDIGNYFIDLYNESTAFRVVIESISTAFKNMLAVGKYVFGIIGEIINTIWENIKQAFSSYGDILKAVLTGDLNEVPGLIKDAFSKGFGNVGTAIKNIQKDFGPLKDTITNNLEEGINNALTGKKYKLLPEAIDASEAANKVANQITNNTNSDEPGGNLGRGKIQAIDSSFNQGIQLESPLKVAAETINTHVAVISESLLTGLANMLEFKEAAAMILEENAENFAVGFGEILGSIASGNSGVADLGKLFLGTIADMAVQLGKMAIGIGIAVQGIKAALSSLNPVLAIAAGVALVALGSVVKNSISNLGSSGSSLPQFANGGVVGGSSKYGDKILARVNSEELILNKDQTKVADSLMNNSGSSFPSEVKFRIGNDELIGTLKRGLQGNLRGGGSLNLNLG